MTILVISILMMGRDPFALPVSVIDFILLVNKPIASPGIIPFFFNQRMEFVPLGFLLTRSLIVPIIRQVYFESKDTAILWKFLRFILYDAIDCEAIIYSIGRNPGTNNASGYAGLSVYVYKVSSWSLQAVHFQIWLQFSTISSLRFETQVQRLIQKCVGMLP